MNHDTATPYIATIILFKKDGKIAHLLRRNTKWMDNFYGLPGGKVEKDERALAAAIREAKEEVGVTIKPEDLKLRLILHRKGDDSYWVDFLFEALKWEGDLYNAEPDKHAELQWFSLSDLPENIIPVTKFYFESLESGDFYKDYGFQESSTI